ncbi:hypothetical protein MTO96_008016 [Rhipicephalus appendiculatus]
MFHCQIGDAKTTRREGNQRLQASSECGFFRQGGARPNEVIPRSTTVPHHAASLFTLDGQCQGHAVQPSQDEAGSQAKHVRLIAADFPEGNYGSRSSSPAVEGRRRYRGDFFCFLVAPESSTIHHP